MSNKREAKSLDFISSYFSNFLFFKFSLLASGFSLFPIFIPMKRWLPFIFLMSVFILSHTDLFSQGCSMCSATSKNASDEDNSVGEQLNTGILYLMAIPYILIFLVFRKKIFAFFREMGGMYGKK